MKKIRIPVALVREASKAPEPPGQAPRPARSNPGDPPRSANLRVWLAFTTGLVSICSLTIVHLTVGTSFVYVLGLSAVAVLPAVIKGPQ